MSLSRSIANNTIVQLAGKVITTGISLFLLILISRSLGVSGFGEYTAALAYSQLFAVFADLGVNVHLIKRLNQPSANYEEEVGGSLTLRFVSATTVLIIAFFLMQALPYSGAVRSAITIGLFAIWAQTINSLFVSILQARLQMKYAVITEIIGRIAVLIVTVTALHYGQGLLWIMGAITTGAALNALFTYYFVYRLQPFTLNWNSRLWKTILISSLPISVTAILSFIYFKIDTVLLSTLPLIGKDNVTEVGIYGAAYKILELLLIVPGIFLGNIFPVLSNFVASKDARLGKLIQTSFDILFVSGAFITVSIFIFSKPLITLVAGAGFAEAAAPLKILSIAVLISYFSGIFTYCVLATERQKSLVIVYLIATVINASLNFVFIPHYSYMAAATTTAITELVVFIGAYIVCQKALKLQLSIGNILKTVSAIIITGLAMWLVRDLNMFVVVAAGAVLYALQLNILKLFKFKDMGMILKRPTA